MKKIIISVCLFGTYLISAQDISKNAIGLRLSSGNGLLPEASYQRKIANSRRLEFDLGAKSDIYSSTFQLVALHQWVWEIQQGFQWYAGCGAGVGSWRSNNTYIYNHNINNVPYNYGTYAFLAGDVGLEYNFDFPLQVSLDFRPQIGVLNYNTPLDLDLGVSARYRF